MPFQDLHNKVFKSNLGRRILYLTVTAFLSVFILSFVLFAMIYSGETQSDNEKRLQADLERMQYHMGEFKKDLHMCAHSVTCSRWTQLLLSRSYNLSDTQLQMYYRNAAHVLNMVSTINIEQNSLFMTLEREIVRSNDAYDVDRQFRFETQDWYDTLLSERKYVDYSGTHLFDPDDTGPSINLFYPVLSIYDFKLRGYYAVNVPYEQFDFLKESVSDGVDFVVKDASGQIVTTNLNSKNPLPERIVESEYAVGSGHTLLSTTLSESDWQVWLFRENTSFLSILASSLDGILILIPVVFTFLTLSLLFSRYLTRPIVQCTRALAEIQKHNFGVKMENRYQNEIGEMLEGFNTMSAELSDLVEKNRRFFELQKKAEFKLHQQRINPHFLCNTLEMINGMILSGQEKTALNLCELLGLMYRYDLGKDDIVTIRQEVDYLKTYLSIIQYSKRDLSVTYDIKPEVLDSKIVKFIIQPVVENSIRHGFRSKSVNCHITLQMRQVQGELTITVIDNGEGIPEAKLAALRQDIAKIMHGQTMKEDDHVGLINTVSRLYLHYGARCVFTIDSILGRGTITNIRLPVQE